MVYVVCTSANKSVDVHQFLHRLPEKIVISHIFILGIKKPKLGFIRAY